jgi:DNA-binding MarR family transcriptional regulator
MKKDWLEQEHCPYCKRHCSLKDPHCGKGKTLAKSMSEKVKTLGDTEKEELKKVQSDLKLSFLYEKGIETLSKKSDGKESGKKIRSYILNILAEKSDMTPKELKEYTGLEKEELKKVLDKLEDKGEISMKDSKEKGKMLLLTQKGEQAVRLQLPKKDKEGERFFSVLTEEEKENLEIILSKLIGSRA